MKKKLRDTRLPQAPIVPDAGDEYGKLPDFITFHTGHREGAVATARTDCE
jgi:hypothetical protein